MAFPIYCQQCGGQIGATENEDLAKTAKDSIVCEDCIPSESEEEEDDEDSEEDENED